MSDKIKIKSSDDKFTDDEGKAICDFLMLYFDDIIYHDDIVSARMSRENNVKGIDKDRVKYESFLIEKLAEFMEKNNFQYTYISGPISIAVRAAKHIFI